MKVYLTVINGKRSRAWTNFKDVVNELKTTFKQSKGNVLFRVELADMSKEDYNNLEEWGNLEQ